MGILELIALMGSGASIYSGIDAARKHFINSTAEALFKKCLVDTVKQSAPALAHLTETGDPETVRVDINMLDDVINSLSNIDITALTSLREEEKLAEITALFQECIILPGHQLTSEELTHRIQPVLKKTIANFYRRLTRNQEAFNQSMLEIMKVHSQNQERSIEYLQSSLELTQELNSQFTDFSDRYISDVVTTEHESQIDNARDLLKEGSPQSTLYLLENLKQRIWRKASEVTKFRILTNMAAAQFALNQESEGARLLIKAFQYNPEDELALSNLAVAYFILGETEKAEAYAKQTLDKNSANTNAYVVLVRISKDEETLERVIDKVPEYLRNIPQIAHAISEIARQRRNLEEARKWCEITVEDELEDIPDFKAALATILVEQVLDDHLAACTEQLNDSEKEQLKRAIGLFTEVWNRITETELRTSRIDWIINRGTAYFHLGEVKAAIKDLNTALEIEPLHPVLLKNRAILAFKEGNNTSAIEFLETIESLSETPEVPIILANILLVDKRFDKAITILNDFLTTDPPSELRENANHLLVSIYIAAERIEEAKQIVTAMHDSSPTSVLNLVNAARISKATGANDDALSLLKEAYDHAKNSDTFEEIVELADELCIYGQFEKAATLYEKVTDTNLNSQLTQRLLNSYYFSGERKKTLEICQVLREKYGVLKHISEMEFLIYNEIGDMDQTQAVGKLYIDAFPDDIEMQIHLAVIYSRSNRLEDIERLLDRSFDLKNLSLRSCFDLAHLYRIRSKPETALDIMYETRRTYYDNSEAHLKYVGLFYTVSEEMGELLQPTQVQLGTAVCLDRTDETHRYIIEKRQEAERRHNELDENHRLAQRLLGKHVGDDIHLQQNTNIRKVVDIRSKYVYALQESLRKFPELFPDTPGLCSIKLDDSHEADDSEKFQPLFDLLDQQHEASLRIESAYKENPLPIGVFNDLTGGNVLDTWSLLMSKPDLGVRCSIGNPEERAQALALFGDPQPKLVVDLISLLTLHRLGASDAVVRAFGKLSIAQSTIDELQQIIDDRKGMGLKREGMGVGKQGNQYVKAAINPEEIKQGVEYLEDVLKWTRENCEVYPCTAALEINQLRKQELDALLQSSFFDTLLIASEPGHLLLSDDEPLRSYAKTALNHHAGTNFHIEGVWTQVVLGHCVKMDFLDKAQYDRMTIKLVCSRYYHTVFNADLLIEAAEQSDWQLVEPYNSLVQALGGQRVNLSSALNVAVDFLYQLWLEPMLPRQRQYLASALLDGLTSGRSPREVLGQLANWIQTYEKFILVPLAEQDIISLIQAYARTRSF